MRFVPAHLVEVHTSQIDLAANARHGLRLRTRLIYKATAHRRLSTFRCTLEVISLTDGPLEFSIHYWPMLNDKQFQDRAVRELREIGKQVLSLATDRDLYRRLEAEVIPSNPRLSSSGSPYLSMVRGAYTDAATMRLRRLFAPDAALSLRRLLSQISEYPALLHDKLTARELSGDLAELDRLGVYLKEHVDPHFSNHERTPAALATTNRELDRAIDLLIDCIRRYYWIVANSYIDLDVSFGEDPLDVFRFPWVEA